MRLLAVNQFYYPDLSATSQLLTQLCEDLAAGGDEVTVLATRGDYLGGGSLHARERVRGVTILRPPATRFGKRSIAARLSDYGTFWASAVARVASVERPDVILTLTTPPMIATGVGAVAAARRIPMVIWMQDIYPELAIAFGVLPERGAATETLRVLMRMTHRLARFTVALSEGMAERIERQGQVRERIRVIQNWADSGALAPISAEQSTFRFTHGLNGRFVVMYSGNLGMGHELATLVEAARILRDRSPEVFFAFVGEGSRRKETEELASGLDNVGFFPYAPQATLADSLSAADVHLVTLREGLEGLLVPSKLYGALAVGRPVISVGPGSCEVASVIRAHDVGWVVPPGDHAALAQVIAGAASDRDGTRARNVRARRALEEHYDRRVAVARWRDVLREAASG
jgi:glycosyltransferase involved in cell wall biosynthesis